MTGEAWWARSKPGLQRVRGQWVRGAWQPWHKTRDGDTGLCGRPIRPKGGVTYDYTSSSLDSLGWRVKGRICKTCKELRDE